MMFGKKVIRKAEDVMISQFSAQLLKRNERDDALHLGIESLCRRELGDGSVYAEAMEKSKRPRYCEEVYYAWDAAAEKVVGFAFAGFQMPGEYTLQKWNLYPLSSPDSGADGDKEATLDAIAVDRRWQGLGIGRKLLDQVIADMRYDGRSSIKAMAVVWKRRPLRNEKLLESAGFRKIGTVENAFTEDSVRNGWRCRECHGICHHSADVYVLSLEGKPQLESRLAPGRSETPVERPNAKPSEQCQNSSEQCEKPSEDQNHLLEYAEKKMSEGDEGLDAWIRKLRPSGRTDGAEEAKGKPKGITSAVALCIGICLIALGAVEIFLGWPIAASSGMSKPLGLTEWTMGWFAAFASWCVSEPPDEGGGGEGDE